jgi:hypothetical protein
MTNTNELAIAEREYLAAYENLAKERKARRYTNGIAISKAQKALEIASAKLVAVQIELKVRND